MNYSCKSPKTEFTSEWSHNQLITTYFISATHLFLDTLASKSWLKANTPKSFCKAMLKKSDLQTQRCHLETNTWLRLKTWRLKSEIQSCWLFDIFLPPRQSVRGPLTGASAVIRLLHLLSDTRPSSHALRHGAFQCDEVPEGGLKLCPYRFNLNYLLSFSFNKMYSYSIVCQG